MASFGYQVLGFGAGGEASGLIEATGGCITCSGVYRIHRFTGNGTFTVSSVCACSTGNVDYVVIAGGAGGGQNHGGGGGAGGFREAHVCATSGPYTASPLASSSSIPISASPGAYPITVGGGGVGGTPGTQNSTNGATSTFSTISGSG